MRPSQRRISLLLALALFLSSLVCVLSLAEGAHHDCTGVDCPVCARLRQRIDAMSGAGAPVSGVLFLPRPPGCLLPAWTHMFRHATPVDLKVRLTT